MDKVLDDHWREVDGTLVHVVIDRSLDFSNRKSGIIIERVTISAGHAGCGTLELEAAAGSYFFALGRQDALTGHPAFDDRYIVKTSDEEAMRFWFGEHELDAVLASYDARSLDPYALTFEADTVRLVASWWHEHLRDGAELDRDFAVGVAPAARTQSKITRLDEAVAAVAFLAGRGARLAAEWRARLEPLGPTEAGAVWRTDDRYALTVERGRTTVRLDFPWQLHPLRRRGLRTRLTVPWPDPGAAVIWPRSWSWRARPRLARGVDLDLRPPWHGEARDAAALVALPGLPAALTAIGVDWLLVGDGSLAIGWDRIVADRDRLAAAIAQLARWVEHVAPATGPYR